MPFLWDRGKQLSTASDQGPHCLLTECSLKIEKKMIHITQQPFKLKWTDPIDNWLQCN